jgi:hypothetical protein
MSKRLSAIKRNAKLRNISYNLPPKYLWDLFEKQNRRCALSGRSIEFGFGTKETTASLDRIDSLKGYIEGNVQWLHNIAKQCMSDEKFIQMCEDVIKNRGKKYGDITNPI